MLAKPNEENMNADKPHPIEQQMDYDIVEDIKKAKENVSLFEMCKVLQQRERLLKSLEASDEKLPAKQSTSRRGRNWGNQRGR